jgi:3-hydroxyisobutyrate dehydrogenase
MGGERERIGFIGLGIMGRPMATNLLQAGFSLTVHNRTRTKEKPLAELGAGLVESPAEIAKHSDIVIVMVPDTPDVQEVVAGEKGIAKTVHAGQLVIDMSTISPDAEREMAVALEAKGCDLLDAPVTGGDVGAQKATLTIMVGGKRSAFERALPILQVMGKSIHHVGPIGAGQSLKLCNQILCAVNMMGLCEALLLARRAEIDLDQFVEVLGGGAGGSWQLANLGPKIVKHQFDPGFMIRLMQKDLSLAQALAGRLSVPLPGTAAVQQLYRGLESSGDGALGTQALIRALERLGRPEPDRST